MAIFVITFIVLALVIAGMAIGVMNGRQAIQGSCGGLGGNGDACRFCTRRTSRCKARTPAE